MKNKIFSLVAIAAISLGAWSYSESQRNVELSDLALANVEALAYGELPGPDYAHVSCRPYGPDYFGGPTYMVCTCIGTGPYFCPGDL